MIGRSGCDHAALDTAIIIGVPSVICPPALAGIRANDQKTRLSGGTRMSETNKFIALAGVLAVSLVVAVLGMFAHIVWLGHPVGKDGAWVGDISACVYTVAMVATFAFAASKQFAENRR
jgi:nitrate reductase NapE component